MAATALSGIVGRTIFVKSSQTDAYGVPSNSPVSWSSSDATKAIVQNVYNSNDAVIYCITAGAATITATMVGSVTAAFNLTIHTSAAPSDGYTLAIEAPSSRINQTNQTQT